MNPMRSAMTPLRRTDQSQAIELPLHVVKRDQDEYSGRKVASRRLVYRSMALVLIVAVSIVAGGISGLYRQPKPLQIIMNYLGLEIGAGTDNPVALPTSESDNRNAQAKNSAAVAVPVIKASDVIVALGKLVPRGKVITVAPPSGSGDARIQHLDVADGDEVEIGQILAILDNEGKLQAAIESAEAIVAVREADIIKTRAQVQASLAEAHAALENAEAAAVSARLDFERTSSLYSKKIVAKATFDTKRAASQQSQKQVEQARATLSRYLSNDIDDQSDVVVARKNLEAAKVDLRRAKLDLQQAYVRSPVAGTVLDIHARAGEKPTSNGIMDIGDISNMTAEVEVYETSIRHVSLNDPVQISSPSLPEPLKGFVKRLGLQIKKQSVIASDPAASTDARVVEVIVELDTPSSQTARRFTNLQVEASILVGRQQ